MSIGKSSIKRIENNGYSNVKTTAPDMENSHVIAAMDQQVAEKIVAPVEKKTRAKKAAKQPAAVADVKEGLARVAVGEDMPYYLL